jgi:precorrin-2 dehydrogenase / sirohydrochlorin ferrochelatase
MGIAPDQNPLYPVFFKLDRLKMLIVGAGEVGMEKLHFIIKSSPNANIRIIATWAAPDVQELADKYPQNIQLVLKEFEKDDVQGSDIIIAATNFPVVNQMVYEAAKSFGKIVNVADTPDLCDFYMGSIVTRGALKVAISTNGKSPTFAKRFRQVLEDILPTETNDLLTNLKVFRDKLKGDFNHKVKELNKLTETLITHD